MKTAEEIKNRIVHPQSKIRTEMNPKDEAKELVEKFSKYSYTKNRDAKQCALISLEREKDLLTRLYQQIPENIDREAWRKWRVSIENAGIENEQVKTEIEKL